MHQTTSLQMWLVAALKGLKSVCTAQEPQICTPFYELQMHCYTAHHGRPCEHELQQQLSLPSLSLPSLSSPKSTSPSSLAAHAPPAPKTSAETDSHQSHFADGQSSG